MSYEALVLPTQSDMLAVRLGVEHVGVPAEVRAPAPLDAAGPDHIAYAEKAAEADASSAGVLICQVPLPGRTCLLSDDPKLTFIELLAALRPPQRTPGVHPTAVVEGALGAGVEVGPHAVIGAGASIGDRCVIGAGAVIGADCQIGPDTRIDARAVLYSDTVVGARCRVLAGAVIGGDGFSFHPTPRGLIRVPQIGRVRLEDDVEVGACATIDRAFLEETVVGAGTKIDNLVQVGHNTRIGRSCVLAGQAGVSGSVTLGDRVQLAGQAGVADHVSIGDGARIGAKTGVPNDIDGGDWFGTPAIPVRQARRVAIAIRRLPDLLRDFRKLTRRVDAMEKRAAEGAVGHGGE